MQRQDSAARRLGSGRGQSPSLICCCKKVGKAGMETWRLGDLENQDLETWRPTACARAPPVRLCSGLRSCTAGGAPPHLRIPSLFSVSLCLKVIFITFSRHRKRNAVIAMQSLASDRHYCRGIAVPLSAPRVHRVPACNALLRHPRWRTNERHVVCGACF